MNHDLKSSSSRRLPSALLLGAGVLALAACQREAPAAFDRPPSPVVVAEASLQNVPVYLDEIGKCAAREMVAVRPQISGQITEIHFADGADLRAGDLLFTIDPRPFQADLDAAEARLAQAEVALDLARTELRRVEGLADPRAVSQQEIGVKKSAVEAAEALARQGRAAVETARIDLERCSIRSPIEGRAGQRLLDAGNVVTANDEAPLLVIQRLDPIYADFTVAEHELTAVQRQMAAGSLPVEVRLPGELDPRAGELTFLDSAVHDSTGTVKLRATLPNADRRFWPGRFVEIRLVLSTLEDAVLVPATAPQRSAQGPFVYVVKADSTAELRHVTPGQRQGDLVVIAQGLEPGERVVVEGQLGVVPGGSVRIVAPGASSAAPGDASVKTADGKP